MTRKKRLKVRLALALWYEYTSTRYQALREIAILHRAFYDPEEKMYLWLIPLEKWDRLELVLGRTIVAPKEDIEFIVNRARKYGIKIETQPTKGVGYIKIRTVPEKPDVIYIEQVVAGEVQVHEVPIENVELVWNIIKRYPIGKKVSCRTIAEHICRELNLKRFFKPSGRFSWELFFGKRREYHQYYYYPIKVLQVLDAINYYKDGKIARKREKLHIATLFKEKEITIFE